MYQKNSTKQQKPQTFSMKTILSQKGIWYLKTKMAIRTKCSSPKTAPHYSSEVNSTIDVATRLYFRTTSPKSQSRLATQAGQIAERKKNSWQLLKTIAQHQLPFATNRQSTVSVAASLVLNIVCSITTLHQSQCSNAQSGPSEKFQI